MSFGKLKGVPLRLRVWKSGRSSALHQVKLLLRLYSTTSRLCTKVSDPNFSIHRAWEGLYYMVGKSLLAYGEAANIVLSRPGVVGSSGCVF